jgi:hypothetical protein
VWSEGGTVSRTRKVIRGMYIKLENAAVQSLQLRAIAPTSLILKLFWVPGGDSSPNGGSCKERDNYRQGRSGR